MALIDVVKKTIVRLWSEDSAWQVVFAKQGFDFSIDDISAMDAATLISHLLGDNLEIDRTVKGFEDFALAGKRMIEPGKPAQSLLYHAFASPNMYYTNDNGDHLTAFPSLFEIDALENFIYALQPLDINALIQEEGPDNVAIAMFSYEYRQALNTTHRKHADMCFSRTGVARVGTDPHKYEPNLRAFTTFLDQESKGMRVTPARYAAFIAVRRHIKDKDLSVLPYMGRDKDDSDVLKNRGFWVPIHKLFAGDECLKNQNNLSLSFTVHHENIKLKKVCEYLKQTKNRDLEASPYTITEGLVEMLFFSDDGGNRTASVWLSPVPHPLVEEALTANGERVTIKVPPDPENEFFAALTLREVHGARPAPEYVNVRRKLESNGQITDLNTKPNVAKIVAKGNYNAVMHTDHSCDGWIKAVCPELSLPSLPAYSLSTAPDFIPFAEQRELIEWGESQKNQKNYWALEPWALSDSRLLPNVTLKNSPFSTDMSDNTIQTLTAIVGPLQSGTTKTNSNLNKAITRRSSFLPDAAAGEFQPGWDITWDRTANNNPHLSAYGLGSPFLEDAKLCAALSTFWPAAAPDIARSYVMEGWPSICPLTDEEIGQVGNAPWDGVTGPQRVTRDNKDWVALPDFNHVDYVTQGLLGQFSIATIGQIDIDEYENRVDALWHIYKILNALNTKPKWRVLSFRKISKNDSTLIDDIGQSAANKMQDNLFAVVIYHKGEQVPSDDNLTVFEEITRENKFYVDNSQPRKIWRRKGAAAWLEVVEETTPS